MYLSLALPSEPISAIVVSPNVQKKEEGMRGIIRKGIGKSVIGRWEIRHDREDREEKSQRISATCVGRRDE